MNGHPVSADALSYHHLVHVIPVSGPVLVQLDGLVELPLCDDPRRLEVVLAARTDGVAGLVEDVLDQVGELGARVGGDVALLQGCRSVLSKISRPSSIFQSSCPR